MNRYERDDDWRKLCEFGIDTTQRLPNGYTMERTLFDCGEYSWDGIFNIVTLPENMSIYHGGGSAANNLAFIPLGTNFLGNLARNGPAGAISDAVPVIERKEAIYPLLSQYGGPNPTWFSNPYTANEYARRNDDPTIRANCSKTFNVGQFAIQVRDCILAFKLMRDMKLILIDDPYNIMVIRGLFAGMSQQEIQDIQPMLASATKPGAMAIRSPDDLVRALSLYCFGSESDRTDNYDDRFKPIIHLAEVEIREDEDHAVEHCNRFYLRYQEAQQDGSVEWRRIPHFVRRSSYDWDLAIGTALCFLLRTRYPAARYDGYGAPYVRSEKHTSWQPRPGGPSYFSLEMTICNAADILTRDYDNPIDWQSPHAPGAVPCPQEAREYIDFLDKHVVTNYKQYAGDMYENMVWTMLVTEHMLRRPDPRFGPWQGTVAQYGNLNATAYVASILSFFYNFRQTFGCRVQFDPDTAEASYYACNVDATLPTYTGMLASRSLVNALNIIGGGGAPVEAGQVYLLVNAFLDAQPCIFRFLLQHDDSNAANTADEVLSMLVKNSYQSGTPGNPELLDLMVFLGVTVVFASILIQGSPVGVIPILTEPIPGQARCNLRSERFPWIENRSRPYPGEIRGEAEINAGCRRINDRCIALTRAISARKDAQIPDVVTRAQREVQQNLVYPGAIQTEVRVMYMTLFPERKDRMAAALGVLDQMYAELKKREVKVEDQVRLEWEQDHRRRPAIDVMGELGINVQDQLHHVIGLPVGTEEERKKAKETYYAMWVGYLGVAYIPAMEACNSRLTLQINQRVSPDVWIPAGMRKFERVWYTLKFLKPVLGAIFETYSMTQYPSWKTYPARYNHNSLNHLRSVWYTAVFLANSGFTNNLNNMDIFLLLLGSVFKSIGRTDETDAGPSARDYDMRDVLRPFREHGNLPNQRWPVGCGYDFSTWTMPGTVVISMTIAYQVLCSISHQFPLQESKYSETIVFTSGIIAKEGMLALYDTCPEMKEVVDSVSIMCMGHYLDHCRPTTRFSQLDTETTDPLLVPNNPFHCGDEAITYFNRPRGQPWLKFLLQRHDFNNDGWPAFKQFWFNKQIDVLERTGFQRRDGGPILQASAAGGPSIGPTPPIGVDWGQRCATLFDPAPTVHLVELANSFDRAWDAIFTPQSLSP